MRRRGQSGLTRRFLAVVIVTGAILWFAGFLIFVDRVPDAVEEPGRTTDAVVVLTGGTLRLETGLDLLESKMAEKLFVSGVHRGVDVSELIEVTQQNPRRVECCLVLGYDAENTSGNAEETARWVRAEGYRSIRVVTADYHMPRSMVEFRALLPGVRLIAHPVFPDHVKSSNWYLYPGTALLLMGEYSKTLVAVLRIETQRLLSDLLGKAEQE